MLLSVTTTEARAPWDTIPMTRRPFRSRPENSSPATLSCYNRKQIVRILTANLMSYLSLCYTSNVTVHTTVFCAQYEAQCACTDLPSHYKDTKIPGVLGIHWSFLFLKLHSRQCVSAVQSHHQAFLINRSKINIYNAFGIPSVYIDGTVSIIVL